VKHNQEQKAREMFEKDLWPFAPFLPWVWRRPLFDVPAPVTAERHSKQRASPVIFAPESS
jgi:hypothetical protein